MTERVIEGARQLLSHGLARSALRMLSSVDAIGHRMNNLRTLARQRSAYPGITAGIHALGTFDSIGLVIPLCAEQGSGRPNGLEDDAWKAHEIALNATYEHISGGKGRLPRLHLVLPDMLCICGKSIGLAAGLAFAAKLSGRDFDKPVIATGEVSKKGKILPVSGMKAKLIAAKVELSGTKGIVLVPPGGQDMAPEGLEVQPVSSFAEALQIVFDESKLPADEKLISFEQLITRNRDEIDHRKAIGLLESYSLDGLETADQARLLLELGIRLRHTGQTDRAAKLHSKARALFPDVRDAYGRQMLEDMEIETFATMMGQFLFDDLEPMLRQRLKGNFANPHNRVRCQGMLAQLLSTVGRHDEVIPLRENNLALQEKNDAMRREIPRTLCSLTYEAARAGREDVFNHYAKRLLDETTPGDTEQQRYNDFAIVRGMVLLGRHDELISWLDGRSKLFGHSPGHALLDLFSGDKSISDYPEVSTARALVRLLGKTGQPDAALALADRVQTDQKEPLLRWLALLANVERSLVFLDVDRKPGAIQAMTYIKRQLAFANVEATAFYFEMYEKWKKRGADDVESSRTIDFVYY
jgi:tetratricopeptide (TPR) repeat protein